MVMLFMDPFEGYEVGQLDPTKAATLGCYMHDNNKTWKVKVEESPLSEKHLYIYSGTGTYAWSYIGITLPKYEGVTTFGFSLNFNSMPLASESKPSYICWFSENNNNSASLIIRQDGSLRLGTLTTEPYTILLGTISYIEIVLNYDTGDFELFVDDESKGSGSITFSSGNVKRFVLGQLHDATTHAYYDDIYVLDDKGDDNNTRLGPVRVRNLRMKETTLTEFTPTDGENNLSALLSTDVDKFNSHSSEADATDLFKVDTSDLNNDTRIYGIMQNIVSRKTDLGPKRLGLIAKDASELITSEVRPPILAFGHSTSRVYDKTPSGNTWTKDELDSCEFGYKSYIKDKV